MAEILPFIGTRYNSQLIGNLGAVVAPPYDVIPPEFQDELYRRHANNVVRLILPKEEVSDGSFSDKYTRAANTLKTWRRDGILIEDEKPSIYLYEQEFKLPTGEVRRRRGFFALVKLEDYESGTIKAHEQTFAGPKADRLKLIRATHANLSPIFVIFNDVKRAVLGSIEERMKDHRAWEEVVDDDGVIHRLWVVQKKEFVMKLRDTMKDMRLFIADGHHRYETALNFRNEMRDATGRRDGKQPFDYMMMYCTCAEQDGLVILPTHRVLTRQLMADVNLEDALEELAENFDHEDGKADLANPDDAKRVLEKVEKLGTKAPSFGMVFPSGKVRYLTLKRGTKPVELIDDDDLPDAVKELDVTILHHYIMNQVMIGNPEFEVDDDDCLYVRDVKRAFDLLKSKKGALAIIMNATPMEQVMKIVSEGIKMPHKSTYFHPKIISGLVIRNMDCENKKPAPKR